MNNQTKKTAVVLFNLGGPDSKNAIRPFLMNFFMDPNIIRVPIPFRCFIAAAIARRRTKKQAGESYHELGNRSPLLENSKHQAAALEKVLNQKAQTHIYKTFVCMRYWHPMSAQVVREVRDWGADEVIIIPLYPQFSTTTTWSSMGAWNKAAFQAGYEIPTSTLCCYPFNTGFIQASAENIVSEYTKAKTEGYDKIRILMSAHGLPKSVIKEGDPYQWQCEKTAGLIIQKVSELLGTGEQSLDWVNCYQSRVGPQKWIGPSTEHELERAAKDNVAVLIYPHAFTQEHVETLVELDIEYREAAHEMGVKGYYRATTVGTHPAFINGLAEIVHEKQNSMTIAAEGGQSLCPKEFGQCCMRMSATA
jgi:ferrochelatase